MYDTYATLVSPITLAPISQIVPVFPSITTSQATSFAYAFQPVAYQYQSAFYCGTVIQNLPQVPQNYIEVHQAVYIGSVVSQPVSIYGISKINNTQPIEIRNSTQPEGCGKRIEPMSGLEKSEMEIVDQQNNIKLQKENRLLRPTIQKKNIKIKKFKSYLPRVPKKAESVLKKWFMENFYDPYPLHHEKVMLAKESGLPVSRVNYWFQNARKRRSEVPSKFSLEIERALQAQQNTN